jgi:hypothetical protein
MERNVSYFFNLYNKLDKKIREHHPEEAQRFNTYRGAVISKTQLLEMLILRYEDSKNKYDAWWLEAQEKIGLYASSADPEILRQGDAFARRGLFARKSIILDIESFLVFARVMLDYVPWMVRPLLKGHISKNEPRTTDFRLFCDWFENNKDEVQHEDFLKFILDFRGWFYENLRDPRNELVIHLERQYTLDKFSADGTILRMKYSVPGGDPDETFQLGSPPILFKKLLAFHESFETFFIE